MCKPTQTNFSLFHILIFISVFFLLTPNFVQAVSLGLQTNFYIDKNYDLTEQQEITASLQRIGFDAYFYIENQWWAGLDREEQDEVKESLKDLDNEFHNNIYPTLRKTFGSEWKPGIDRDDRVFILFHPMADNGGGYFRENDQYLKIQVPDSNEREMLYLNTDFINFSIEKSFLAHEFTHLITFN
ncbi:MAG: hypothetical protein KAS87_05395, partial [Candidatus Omnitrophica bacterium]|nr:hypothetical protein [Candidatus Omnitrophota bacterium]